MPQNALNYSVKEQVVQLMEVNDIAGLTLLLDELPSREVVHLIGHLQHDDQMLLLTLLSPEVAAEIIEEIPDSQAVGIIEDMNAKDAAAILNEMESDDQTDLINELDSDDAEAILDLMEPDEAASVRKLLHYESDSAGGMMHTEYFSFLATQSIAQVTEDLRLNSEEYRYYQLKYIFAIDRKGKLSGVLEMQDLLLGHEDKSLSAIKKKEVLFVNHVATLDELIEFFHKNELVGVPVVNDQHILVGVVLRKDILEAQTERITMEHLESQGIVGGEELRTMPVWLRAKRRLSWLSVNIFLNIIAASVIAFNQDVLSSVIAMAVFLPIISDMSGCSGNQAVAVSMRELSIGAVTPHEVFRVLRQELSVGLINGFALGLLIAFAAFLWKGNIYLGMVVGSALMINTVLAVSLGGTVPLILKRFGIDPALASGPILTTVTDMIGFLLALTFASMALGNLQGM